VGRPWLLSGLNLAWTNASEHEWSWQHHPNVRRFVSLEHAIAAILMTNCVITYGSNCKKGKPSAPRGFNPLPRALYSTWVLLLIKETSFAAYKDPLPELVVQTRPPDIVNELESGYVPSGAVASANSLVVAAEVHIKKLALR
jgi:hypothetical protein